MGARRSGPLAERAYGAAMRSGWLVVLAAAVGIVGCGRAARHVSSTVRSSGVTVPALSGPGSAGALKFVHLRIEGRPYLFLLDTGAGRTVVVKSVARALHLRLVGAKHGSPTLGCRAATQAARIVDWEIAGRRLPALTVASQMFSELKIEGMTRRSARRRCSLTLWDRPSASLAGASSLEAHRRPVRGASRLRFCTEMAVSSSPSESPSTGSRPSGSWTPALPAP
jgi:hypothetical protein